MLAHNTVCYFSRLHICSYLVFNKYYFFTRSAISIHQDIAMSNNYNAFTSTFKGPSSDQNQGST